MIAITTRSSIKVKPAAIVLLARAVFVLMLWARTMVKDDQLGPCSLFYHAEKAADTHDSARRSSRGFQAGEESNRVLEVELLQHVLGQEHAVDHPEALPVVAAGRVEVFVVGLQEPVIDPVGFAIGPRVGPEHDPVLVFQEEPAGRVGLAAQFGDAGVDINVHVRVGVEPAPDLGEVFAVVGHVGADERRVRMAGDRPDPLGVQLGALGEILAVEEPLGVLVQLVPALAEAVERREERTGIARVDLDRPLVAAQTSQIGSSFGSSTGTRRPSL